MENNQFKVEHDVPIPLPFRHTRKWQELERQMKPGDSVVLKSRLEVMNLRNAIVRAGFSCVSRGVDSDHHRVWKIERQKFND